VRRVSDKMKVTYNMNTFDSHFHIIDDSFPLRANQGYMPPIFTVKDYLHLVNNDYISSLQICGGAVVSGSFQLYDQLYLLNALMKLGNNFVGVTQLPNSVTDDEISFLDSKGIRAIRFNINRGVVGVDQSSEASSQKEALIVELERMKEFARRANLLVGWHSEFYVDSKLFSQPEYYDFFDSLADMQIIVIDHIGMSIESFPLLYKLYTKESNSVYIKATGFGRINFTREQLEISLKQLLAFDSSRVIFGTDLPSTRSPKPFTQEDINFLFQICNDDVPTLENIFQKNALKLYRLESIR
jgi:predicted TIM-barrel fold metal-dependent hydrolase